MNNPLFQFHFIDNHVSDTVIALHGTGGDENDFTFLDTQLKQKYNILTLRGNVIEQGMTRFFKRISFGIFDQENIKEETAKLHTFLTEWIHEQNTSADHLYFLGYSNGANMLLATLFYYPDLMKKLILLHPMLPFEPEGILELAETHIFVSYGLHDQIITALQSRKVTQTLQIAKAKLTTKVYESGHELSQEELADVTHFINQETETSV